MRGRAAAARLVHTQEVAGSSPAPATTYEMGDSNLSLSHESGSYGAES